MNHYFCVCMQKNFHVSRLHLPKYLKANYPCIVTVTVDIHYITLVYTATWWTACLTAL